MNGSKRICITKQDSLESHPFCDNGLKKTLHYVLKNNPFEIMLESQGIDISSYNLQATLLYDNFEDKSVSWVPGKEPFTYRGTKIDSSKIKLDVSIAVLSSQHQDSNFKLKIELLDSLSKPLPGYTIYSDCIQVISKLAVLNNKKNQTGSKKRKNNSTSSSTSVIQKLTCLDEKLDRILKEINTDNASVSLKKRFRPLEFDFPPRTCQPSFETAYFDLCNAFVMLPEQQRAAKIRKCLQNDPVMFAQLASAFTQVQQNMDHNSSIEAVPQQSVAAEPPTTVSTVHLSDLNELDLTDLCSFLSA